jgi:glycosyltransferase involved in cell wall biosynthesis
MNKKPKILFLVQLPPPVHGMSMINQSLLQSQAIAEAFETKFIDLALSKTISAIGHYSLSKFANLILLFPKLVFWLCYFRPQLIYFTFSPSGPALYRDALICLIIKFFRIRLIIHMHGKGLKKIPDSSYKKKIVRWAFKGTSVISLSEGLQNDLIGLPIDKLFIAANGIQKTAVAQKPSLTDRPIRFLFLSNLVKTKGILELIDAAFLLKNVNVNWEMRIVGGDGDVSVAEIVEIINQKDLSNHVTVLGAKYGAEKTHQLNWADVLVFPTYYENECFPLVILEAMMHGIAIVSTFEGAIPEIVEHKQTGLLVAGRSPYLLCESLSYLIHNPLDVKKMGLQSQAKFNNKYTLDRFEQKLIAILKEWY